MNEKNQAGGKGSRCGPVKTLPITTSRLVLRLPEVEDSRSFAGIANNMAIASQMSDLTHPYTQKNAESWIAATRANTDLRKISILITLREGGMIVGATSIICNENGDPEINYFLGEAHWGCGLATEAAQGIIDYAFCACDFERIVGCCRAANGSSRRVLEKCGFQFTGAGMCGCAALNSSFASDEFVLDRVIWESLKRWGANG